MLSCPLTRRYGLSMNQFPPGNYIAGAMKTLPAAGPGLPPQLVVIDAGPMWGRYRVTFKATSDPGQGMRGPWIWTMESGERLGLG